jgi:hypothetical protein
VERKIAGLDRFRALKAIEQTIADFSSLDDIAQPLSDIRDQVQAQLGETREFRALRSIERIVPELSEVLALVEAGPASGDDDRPVGAEPVAAEPASTAAEPVLDGAPQDAFEIENDVVSIETASVGPADDTGPLVVPVIAEGADGPSDVDAEEGPEPEPGLPQPDAMPPGPEAEAVPSLADSVAQLMAQSMAPPRDTHAPPATHPQERSDASLAHAERAA